MTSMELYINNRLCEIDNPQSFSVYLKRQFINPTELNSKDAQKSYSVSLPASAVNNAIFGFKNVEEVSGKFNEVYDARLSVGGVDVFEGKFKLTEITKKHYKGNLGIPKPKTIKDIFGERTLNEVKPWILDFRNFGDSVAMYNDANYNDVRHGNISPCIFPFALYGLPSKKQGSPAWQKALLNDDLNLSMDDFPPAINCVHTIRRLFESMGYKVEGTALDDPRLKNLYMSYRNVDEYQMPWNYAACGYMEIKGKWRNGYAKKEYTTIDKAISPNFYGNADESVVFSCNLFDCVNASITEKVDPGLNIKESIYNDYKKVDMTIPASGYYNIVLNGTLEIPPSEEYRTVYDPNKKILDLSTRISGDNGSQSSNAMLNNVKYELKLFRENQDDIFDITNVYHDSLFYHPNQAIEKDGRWLTGEFPRVNQSQSSQVLFVDPGVRTNLISGMSWGLPKGQYDINPLPGGDGLSHLMVASPIKSWSSDHRDVIPALSITNSPKYVRVIKEQGQLLEGGEIDKFGITIENSPVNSAKMRKVWSRNKSSEWIADGCIGSIIWLEKGEKLHLVSSTHIVNIKNRKGDDRWVLPEHTLDFHLSVSPFKMDKNWLKDCINLVTGCSIKPIKWDDDKDVFRRENIDLAQFLPRNVKSQEWIEQFCKAFNLDIREKDATTFELNMKEKLGDRGYNILDLDSKVDVDLGRSNTDMGFPSVYDIGFTIDEEERGYKLSNERGTELFETGSFSESTTSQKSNFSYNWMLDANIVQNGTNQRVTIPVISKNEPWVHDNATQDEYENDMKKRYTDSPQRFWYRGDKSCTVQTKSKDTVQANVVVDSIAGKRPMVLHYKNKPDSVLNNFFTVFIDQNNNNFTEVECFLSPDEYANIDTCLARFNGDMYYIAEVDSYDPMCKKKAKLKLIRKM